MIGSKAPGGFQLACQCFEKTKHITGPVKNRPKGFDTFVNNKFLSDSIINEK